MLVFMVAAVCAVGNSPVAEAQMSVSVETDRAFVVIDLNTAEVLLQPQWGTLENTANGIVYVPDFVDGNDSFRAVQTKCARHLSMWTQFVSTHKL